MDNNLDDILPSIFEAEELEKMLKSDLSQEERAKVSFCLFQILVNKNT